MPTLSDFILAERMRYADDDNNLFAFSLGRASIYYDFIVIIAERQRQASEALALNGSKIFESPTIRGGHSTDEDSQLFEERRQNSTLVMLETESFFLFAKILLDKLALFVEDYFGGSPGIKLGSHDKLTKNHRQYGAARALVYPDGFSHNLEFLRAHICDYRDKHIAHLRDPRFIKGISYGGGGRDARIVVGPTYPKPSELGYQVESLELSKSLAAIDDYINKVISVIELNRDKSRFRLK